MTSAAPSRLRSALFHALRAAFRALPVSQAQRDRLRQRFLDQFPSIRPAAPRGAPPVGLPRRAYVHSGGPALGHVEHRIEPLPAPLPATLVAFYLPQFHSIPENDAWWGKGFTEWRNVARALPQFEGHAQPRLPGDLGFYDLRNPQTLRNQASLAQAYGIGAFCMYFYWFGGKVLLDMPHQQWLQDPEITLPICLCWANENWTRTWDGRAGEVLIAQAHGPEDDLSFIAHVASYLRDPRYLRVDGKPLLLVYRPGLLPDPAATATRWRTWCRDNGIGEICVGYAQSFERPDPRDIGFDVAVEFPPNLSTPGNITADQRLINPDYAGEILDWREVAHDFRRRPMPGYRLFPGVNCGWDNEPRRSGRGRTLLHSSPRQYREWLSATMFERLCDVPERDRFVFINAWNEWAEGAVLEPDARSGYSWLEATRSSLRHRSRDAQASRPYLAIHAWHPEVLREILDRVQASAIDWQVFVTTSPERESTVRGILDEAGIQAELMVYENRGRDVLPFLRLAKELERRGHEGVVLKIHTKRSLHRADGDAWLRDLLVPLLDQRNASRIVEAFANQPDLGMVAPKNHLLETSQFLGANAPATFFLRSQLGLHPEPAAGELFASGSMYYVRLAAIRELTDLDIEIDQFEKESGQTDGTLAHAFERVVASAVRSSGFALLALAHQGELIAPTPAQHYPFAARTGARPAL